MTAPPGAPRPRLSLKVRPTVRPISLRRGATALLPRNPVTSAHGEKAQSACCWPKRELRLVLSERWAARSLLWPGLNVNRSDRGPLVCCTLDRRNFKADTGKSSVTEHIARLLLLALNVVCCETAIRLELGRAEVPRRAQNAADDPQETLLVSTALVRGHETSF